MSAMPAPFFDDMAGVAAGAAAFWVHTTDNRRIRVAIWRPDRAAHGTVLLLPGRTEYVEKYAGTATELGARGFAVLAIDWRGQGLADRLLADRRIGHVERFADYQKDLAAALALASEHDLPRPLHLLGHSMGGAIGLRALVDGLSVQSCAFTGPMWGIHLSPLMRPLAKVMTRIAPMLGLGTHLAPSTQAENYVEIQPFDGNSLTSDPDMYALMQAQFRAHPELGLGGPSLIWLRAALGECRALAAFPSPDLPCLTILGSDEAIVDCPAVRARMARWPRGTLDTVPGARHEVLMERPETRRHVLDRLGALFSAA